MKAIVHNLDQHPLVAFLFSIIGIGTGAALHLLHITFQVTSSPETIDYVVKVFQCVAYLGGAAAGFVSFHGWWVKRKKK